ncbi:MAG: hypothetical protein ABI831_10900 [Betaproteobacteria bacterium]
MPAEMVYRYHKAIADGVGIPLIAFLFPKAGDPIFRSFARPRGMARICRPTALRG